MSEQTHDELMELWKDREHIKEVAEDYHYDQYGEPVCKDKETDFCKTECEQRNHPLGCFCLYH